jgi:hypothetical protein
LIGALEEEQYLIGAVGESWLKRVKIRLLISVLITLSSCPMDQQLLNKGKP